MRFRHVHRRTKALIAAVVLTSSAQLFATPASWTAAVDGNWTDGTKWSTNPAYPNNGTPSGTSYDATIAAAGGAGGGAYTVTLNSSVAVDSLTLNAAGAALSHTAGTLTTPSINLQQGTYTLAGGSITGATITGSAGAQINVGSATKPGRLDGVTLSGVTLALSSGGDEDTNGPITLQNGGVTFAGYSQMLMWGSSTGATSA